MTTLFYKSKIVACTTNKEVLKINSDKHFGYELVKDFSIVHRHSQIFLLSKLKEHDLMDCHPPVLITIYFNEGLSQNQLASILKFNKGAIAKLLKNMEAKGYIKRLPDENDKRIHRLYLTEYGKEIIPTFFDIEKQWSSVLVEDFSQEEIATLKQLLKKVIENVIRKEK